MRHIVLSLCLSLVGCVFFAVPKELQCQDGDAPSCDGSVLVRCEAGVKVRLDCGDLQCDASRDACGVCGDGLITAGEVCDDENSASNDGCRSDCKGLEVCGDNLVDVGEECDDGNNTNGDGCNSDCSKIEACGDGTQDSGEECDDNNTAPDDGCSPLCQFEFCGDGVTNDISEVCDDGNDIDTDSCIDCQPAICGDGFVRAGVEACDDGVQNSDTDPNACRTNCEPAGCGDGVVDAGEVCDDGNQINGDACDNDCTLPACGDGVAGAGELCFNLTPQNFIAGGRVNNLVKDFDNDGALDYASIPIDTAIVEIAFNDGTGKFLQRVLLNNPSAGIIHGIAAGDFNQDGFLDLAAIDENTNETHIFLNQQSRVFASQQTISVGAAPLSIVAFDLDNDTDDDLATFDANGNQISILKNNAGQFSATPLPVSDLPGCFNCIDAGDVNNDGRQDLVFIGQDFSLQVATNLGNDTFAVSGILFPGLNRAIRVVDFNGDSKPDIIGSEGFSTIMFYTNTTNGTVSFSLQTVGGLNGPCRPAFGDVDGDQDIDIVVGTNFNFQSRLLFFLQGPTGSFSQSALQLAPQPESTDDIGIADFNGDGIIDLASSGFNSGLNIFLGTAK